MGHALNGSMQDALVRMNRMRGKNTLWILGTDHAGIATQAVVEKGLKAEGVSRQELGREEFVKRVWEWKREYGSRIVEQYKRLGASLDYERERFTLDDGYVKAVYRVFKQLYDKGYIYRDLYMVNWDPGSRSAISDLEVENREVEDALYSIDYPVEDSDRVLTVATVRPETMLADTAVAVNPEDERYTDLVGKFCVLPLVGRRLPIIADEHVDPEFGTGALKITPGHDPNDFEIGRKHGLEEIVVIGPDGRLTEAAGEFAGLTAAEAQTAVVAALREQGRLRVGAALHPLRSLLAPLRRADRAADLAAVVLPHGRAGQAGDRGRRRATRCGSRRTSGSASTSTGCGRSDPGASPASSGGGTRFRSGTATPARRRSSPRQAPERCGACGGELRQDEDVLDTWFSSALWPFATLGWPDDTPELRAFYPTSFLTTAREILFLWVARMVMMGIEFPGAIPFQRRLRPLGDPGPRRPPHVEEPRHRDRPAGGDRRARRRRPALRPAGDVLDPGRALLRRQGPAGPRPRQQALERVAIDSAELQIRAESIARKCAAGPSSCTVGGTSTRPLHVEDRWILSRLERTIASVTEKLESLRLRPRRPGGLLVLLARPLRLVPGDRQAAPLRRRGGGLGDAALRARADARAAAPDDAVRHRGDLVLPPGPPRPPRRAPLPRGRRGALRRRRRGRRRGRRSG